MAEPEIIDLNVFDVNDVRQTLENIVRRFEDFYGSRHIYVGLFPSWCEGRKNNIEILGCIADELDVHNRKLNISKIVGASASAVGCAAVAGAAIFTGGLAVLAAGGAASILGGLTTVGSYVVEGVIECEDAKKAKNQLEVDAVSSEELFRIIHRTDELKAAVERLMQFEVFEKVMEVFKSIFSDIRPGRLNISIKPLLCQIVSQLRLSLGDQSRLTSVLTTILSSEECAEVFQIIIDLFNNKAPCIQDFHMFKLVRGGFHILNALPTMGRGIVSSRPLWARGMARALTVGKYLSAVSMAVDIITLMITSRNMLAGSKSELSMQIRACVHHMQKEQDDLQIIYERVNKKKE